MMKLYRTQSAILVEEESDYFLLRDQDWDEFVNDDHLFEKGQRVASSNQSLENAEELLE